MKRYMKFALVCLVSVLVMTTLTGCLHRKKTTYQTYITNILDVNYKGEFDSYIKKTRGSEEDAEASYEQSASYLASQLINHYSLNNAPSEEVSSLFSDTAKVIYSKAKYEVSKAYKSGDDYYVDVTVYPMNILNQVFDDVYNYTNDFNKRIEDGEFNNVEKEDYELQIAQGISDILTDKAEAVEYLSPVVVSVKIIDDGEYYSADSDGLSQVDAAMLAVEGGHASEEDDSTEDTQTESVAD
jgi:hypothetical protein